MKLTTTLSITLRSILWRLRLPRAGPLSAKPSSSNRSTLAWSMVSLSPPSPPSAFLLIVHVEIQPIIHRERVVPVVERTEQHITQHITEPTVHTHEVIYERATTLQTTEQHINVVGQQGIVGQQFVSQPGIQQQYVGQQGIVGQQFVGQSGMQQQYVGQPGLQQQYVVQPGLQQQGLSTTTITQQTFPGTTQLQNIGLQGQPGIYQQSYMNTTRMSREQKAARFEQKALQWERQGNALKAQKNREKV